MEPLYCCWGEGGSGEQHQPSAMEKICVAPVLLEEEWHSSGAGTGRGAQLRCCCSKVRRRGAGPVVDDWEMQRRRDGDAESWRWCCRAAS